MIYRRRLTMACLLVIAVLGGTAVVSRAATSDPPASVPGPQPFDVGAATNVLGDATLQEAAPAPPFVGLATRVTVDPLFGTATTTIPIELPPARLTPDVTIRYSSNGGSGPFALGWALALGSVTRNSANGVPLAYDGSGAYADALGFILVLNGATIELDTCVNPPTCTSWAASAEEHWLDAQFNTTIPNTWQITDKSGTQYTFGNGSGARTGINVSGTTTTYGWYLTDVTDANNNLIHITYQASSNTYAYPQQIDYGGNSGGGFLSIFHVAFGYNTLPYRGIGVQRTSYRNGFAEQLTQLATSVTVWVDTVTTQTNFTRQYQFTYDPSPDNGMPLLTQVDETAASGSGTPPPPSTTFSYSTGAHALSAPSPLVDESGNIQIPGFASWAVAIPPQGPASPHPGLRDWIDVDKDGLPDLVNAAVTSLTSMGTDLYRNLGGGKFRRIANWDTSQVFLSTWDDVRRFVDLTGDGLPDAVQSNTGGCPTATGSSPVGPTTATCAWNYYPNTSGSLAAGASTWGNVPQDMAERFPGPSYNWGNWRRMTAELIDLNGDGRPDILDCWYQMGGTINCNVYWNTGSGFSSQPTPWLVPAEPTSDLPASGGLYDPPGGLLLNWTPLYRVIPNQLTLPSQTIRMIVDMNGDGLPDYVNIPMPLSAYECDYGFCYLYQAPQTTTSWDVYVNTGQGFALTSVPWPVPAGATISATYAALGPNGPITNGFLRDMNGDGLPDYVVAPMTLETTPYNVRWVATTNYWLVSLNTGSGFASPVHWTGTDAILPFPSRAQPSSDGGYWLTDQLVDINGDGIADHIESTGSEIDVRYGTGTRPNLLIKAENGLGGWSDVSYVPATDPPPTMGGSVCTGGTNDGLRCASNGDCPASGTCAAHLPFPTWVASSVATHTGLQGSGNDLTTNYAFAGGYFDTAHRQFRGFRQSQEVRMADARIIQRQYAPSPFAASTPPQWSAVFPNGILSRPFKLVDEQVFALWGPLLKRSTVDWGTAPLSGPGNRVQVHTTRQIQSTYGTDGSAKSKTTTFDTYDTYNNVTSQTVTTTNENPAVPSVTTLTEYDPVCHSKPTRVTINSGGWARSIKEATSYTSQCNPQYLKARLAAAGLDASTGTLITTATLSYNSAGQPAQVIDANNNPPTTITYDCSNGLFPCSVTNAAGETTSKTYDLQWGKPASITPPTGSQAAVRYAYDGLGRLKTVLRPLDSYFAQQLTYVYGSAGTPSRVDTYTRHPNATVAGPYGGPPGGEYRLISTFYDSFGRKLETKLAQNVDGGATATAVVTDAVTFDAAGRQGTAHVPRASSSGAAPASLQTYEPPLATWDGTSFLYDVLDRATRVTNPDGRYRTFDFSVAGQTTTSDENYTAALTGIAGTQAVLNYDGLGRLVYKHEISGPASRTEITQTKTDYDALNRASQVTVTDVASQKTAITTYGFDSMSRRTSMNDPDSGLWNYKYDLAGNLLFEDDPKTGQGTQFEYDTVNRVTRRFFIASDSYCTANCTPTREFRYSYGTYDARQTRLACTSSCPTCAIGKLAQVIEPDRLAPTAPAGATTTCYDLRGRPVQVEKRIHASIDGVATIDGTGEFSSATTATSYNVADQVDTITYPADTIYPNGEGVQYGYNAAGQLVSMGAYLTNLTYDVFGRSKQISHGNNTFDALDYWGKEKNFNLKQIRTSKDVNNVWQNLNYDDFDPVGRIRHVLDSGPGGALNNTASFTYDGLGRLRGTSSSNSVLNSPEATCVGGLAATGYCYDGLGNITSKEGTALTYSSTKPHNLTQIGGVAVPTPDANGNRSGKSGQTYQYTEDDRVKKITVGAQDVYFLYDYSGQRVAKVVATGSAWTSLTRYYSDLAEDEDGYLTKYYLAAGRVIASQRVPGFQYAAVRAPDPLIQLADVSGWTPRLVVVLRHDLTAPTALTFTLVAAGLLIAPWRRKRVVGIAVRHGHVLLVLLTFTVGSMPLPIFLRRASAQAATPTPAPAVTPSPPAAAPTRAGSDPAQYGLPNASVELVYKRGKSEKHFRHADGSYSAVFGAGPLHYHDADGAWRDIDLNFHASGNDQVVDRVDDVRMRIPAGGNHLEITDVAGNGIRWLTPQHPATAGNQARYTDGEGLQWTYITTPTGVKQTATVTAARGSKRYIFNYQMLGSQTDFSIDAEGNAVANGILVPRVVILRADGVQEQAGPWQLLPGTRLQFEYDDSNLPQPAFPYVIDPSTSTTFSVASATDDGWVMGMSSSYPPACGYYGTTLPYNVARTYFNGQYNIAYGLARWNTSSLGTSATITSASFRAYPVQKGDANARYWQGAWYTWSAVSCTAYVTTAPTATAFSALVSSVTLNTYNSWTLSNLSNINKTGTTYLRVGISGGVPTGQNYVNFTNYDTGSNVEQLVVNYTLPDLAIGKVATQSSTFEGNSASRANDGNTNGNLWSGSVSCTNNDVHAWWQVDLASLYSINQVRVWNRTDCCSERLSDFYVFVSDVAFTSTDLTTTITQPGVSSYYTAGQGGTPTTITVNRTGRYVRVQLSGTNFLQLAEVEVLSQSTPAPTPTLAPTPTPPGGSSSGGVLHYHLDHLGSVQVMTMSDGTVYQYTRYKPYGEVRGHWDRNFVPLNNHCGSDQYCREFTGYVTEPLSGLEYAVARVYDPALGMFLTHDPIRNYPNPYAYVSWDPTNQTDPTGMDNSDWTTSKCALAGSACTIYFADPGALTQSITNYGLAQFIYSSAYDFDQSFSGAGVRIGGVEAGVGGNLDRERYDLNLLTLLGFAAAGGESYRAMLAAVYVVLTRLSDNGPGFRDLHTIEQVIYQTDKKGTHQFDEPYGKQWKKASGPSGLTARDVAAYRDAQTAARAAYYGTEPNPTNGALWFHSFEKKDPGKGWFHDAILSGAIRSADPEKIGRLWFFTR